MSKIKYITEELINERLEARGFGDKQISDEELARESVLNHFGVQLVDQWTDNASFFVYEEYTKDGYTVYIATENPNNINICEDVYYYDHDLGDSLAEFIRFSNGDEDFPEKIYVDDFYTSYIDSAMQQLFEELNLRLEEEVIDELLNEGYEQQD